MSIVVKTVEERVEVYSASSGVKPGEGESSGGSAASMPPTPQREQSVETRRAQEGARRLDLGELREAIANAMRERYGVAPRECVDALASRFSTGYGSIRSAVEAALRELESRLRAAVGERVESAYSALARSPEGRVLLSLLATASILAGGGVGLGVPTYKELKQAYDLLLDTLGAFVDNYKRLIRSVERYDLQKWLARNARIEPEGGALTATIGESTVRIEPWLAYALAYKLLRGGRTLTIYKPRSGFRVETSAGRDSVTVRYLLDIEHYNNIDRETPVLVAVFCSKPRDEKLDIKQDARAWTASAIGWSIAWVHPGRHVKIYKVWRLGFDKPGTDISCGCGGWAFGAERIVSYTPIVMFMDHDYPSYSGGFRVKPKGLKVDCLLSCAKRKYGGWLPATAIVEKCGPISLPSDYLQAVARVAYRRLLEEDPGSVCGGGGGGRGITPSMS